MSCVTCLSCSSCRHNNLNNKKSVCLSPNFSQMSQMRPVSKLRQSTREARSLRVGGRPVDVAVDRRPRNSCSCCYGTRSEAARPHRVTDGSSGSPREAAETAVSAWGGLRCAQGGASVSQDDVVNPLCRSCLERLAVAARSQHEGTLRCPICREAVPLPEPGVAALPPSFLVNQLLDLVASRRREVVPKCALHPAGPELLFCEACDQVFCSSCLGPAHADPSHTVVPFSIAVKRMSEILLYKSQLCLSKLDAAAEAVSAEITRLDAAAEEVMDQVEASFREIQDLVEQRRKSLLATLQALWDHKKETLEEQLNRIQNERSQLDQECCTQDSQLDVRNLTKKISDLDAKMGSLDHLAEPRENCYLHFDCAYNSALDDIAQALKIFGKIETSRTFPPLCTINIKDCPAYVRASALLRTYDCDGRPQTVGGDPVAARLVICGDDEEQLEVKVIDRGNGEYAVTFPVPRVTRYRLDVSVLGRPLQGSPFEFAATDNIDPDAVFGRRGDGTDSFHQPVAVVCGPEGLLYVLDTGNCRIKVLTPELRFVRHLTEVGVEERGGTGLAFSPSADTLVACNWRTRLVTEFTADGTIVRSFTHADLQEPTALAVNSACSFLLKSLRAGQWASTKIGQSEELLQSTELVFFGLAEHNGNLYGKGMMHVLW
ncbi:hypothetical protein V5799_007947 [Amblyomma americanum]|uniref:B box-type domain-containing protein n=1 Tax=Amblyomma americanum TaxID=6943 RepID=A0AAQ4FG24_AMBAM